MKLHNKSAGSRKLLTREISVVVGKVLQLRQSIAEELGSSGGVS